MKARVQKIKSEYGAELGLLVFVALVVIGYAYCGSLLLR
jgi:hypothetical protein